MGIELLGWSSQEFSALERLWFKHRSLHELKQMHKLLYRILRSYNPFLHWIPFIFGSTELSSTFESTVGITLLLCRLTTGSRFPLMKVRGDDCFREAMRKWWKSVVVTCKRVFKIHLVVNNPTLLIVPFFWRKCGDRLRKLNYYGVLTN